jgi:UDP-glucose 4-epimerase
MVILITREIDILALDYLKNSDEPGGFNPGGVYGYSVVEVIRKAREATGRREQYGRRII